MLNLEEFPLDYNQVGFRGLSELLIGKRIGKINLEVPRECLNETFSHRLIMIIIVVYLKSVKWDFRTQNILINWVVKHLLFWTGYDSLHNIMTKKSQDAPLKHVDLDKKISPEDPRYKSALAIMAAKTAYEDRSRVERIVKSHWKMQFIDFFDCANEYMSEEESAEKGHPTQAFIFSQYIGGHELICVSFRGTTISSVDDFCTDLDLFWYPLEGYGKIHAGFLKALGIPKIEHRKPLWPKELDTRKRFAYYKIREVLRKRLKDNADARFIVTGHSLGGALAVLFTTILGYHDEKKLLKQLEGVYTFGQPKIGDIEFCKSMERLLGERYFRFVYAHDVVPKLPFNVASNIKYEHFGNCYYFNIFYFGKVIKGVPKGKSYFVELICAKIEFLRSLILPIFHGSEYREGITRMSLRALAMVFLPGVFAHGVEDYVNLTRLGRPRSIFSMS